MRAVHLLVVCSLLAPTLAAQSRLGPVERRPKLAAGLDTNDASGYFALGARSLAERPDEAAAAFYWAARLDPSSAEALGGRRAALVMRRPQTLKLYMEGGRRARVSKELIAMDTMQLRALRIDPLYYRKYDHTMLMAYYRTELRRDYPTASAPEIDGAIRDYLTSGSDYMRGWVAYSEGRMAEALSNYELAMQKAKNKGYIRIERARVYTLQALLPAAIREFRLASEDLKKLEADKEENVVFYNSSALVEHSMGVLYGRLGQVDSAKAALGRAITEDLSYFAAHLELGRIALAEKDTATAISDLGLAAELATDEPWVQYLHGNTLLGAGRHAEAVTALRKAIELEPFHADSRFALAQALDKSGQRAEAAEAYTQYLAIAPRRDQQHRAMATERAAGLRP